MFLLYLLIEFLPDSLHRLFPKNVRFGHSLSWIEIYIVFISLNSYACRLGFLESCRYWYRRSLLNPKHYFISFWEPANILHHISTIFQYVFLLVAPNFDNILHLLKNKSIIFLLCFFNIHQLILVFSIPWAFKLKLAVTNFPPISFIAQCRNILLL